MAVHRIHVSRRKFCVLYGGAVASLVSGCTGRGGSVIVSDGRLTARPRTDVKTSATGEIKLGLDTERDAILQIPKNAGQSPLPLFVMLLAPDFLTVPVMHFLSGSSTATSSTASSRSPPGFVISGDLHDQPRIYISHGTHDHILPIDRCGRRIAGGLKSYGYDVTFREFDGDHEIPAGVAREGLSWVVKAR